MLHLLTRNMDLSVRQRRRQNDPIGSVRYPEIGLIFVHVAPHEMTIEAFVGDSLYE